MRLTPFRLLLYTLTLALIAIVGLHFYSVITKPQPQPRTPHTTPTPLLSKTTISSIALHYGPLINPASPHTIYFQIQEMALSHATPNSPSVWKVLLTRKPLPTPCTDKQLMSPMSPWYCFPGYGVLVINPTTRQIVSATHTPPLSYLSTHLAYTKYLLQQAMLHK